MARNYVQPGDTITMTAPYVVTSGAGMLVGVIFAIALAAAASGAAVEAKRSGVWDLPKATGQAWVADTTKLYWDNTNKVVTSTASGNVFIGVARANAASGDTTGRVLLSTQIT